MQAHLKRYHSGEQGRVLGLELPPPKPITIEPLPKQRQAMRVSNWRCQLGRLVHIQARGMLRIIL